MLPTTLSANASQPGRSRASKAHGYFSTYFRRIVKPRQMDFEYTFWLMLQLCISPKTAYRHTSYHKQTKNQWARDDPAFVVVLCMLVAVAATAYCVTYGHNVWHSLMSILSAVVIDCLLLGIAIATACWFIANRFLRKTNLPQHQVEQHLEWLYAFDVHCNSYFPLFLLLYVLQFLVSPLLLWKSFLSATVSCALYAVALSYYHYLNFLGYSALPFLERTEVFLWPVGVIFLALPFAVLTGFNPTREKMKKTFFKQSLPLGFLLAIIVSMSWPAPGGAVAHWQANGWKIVTTTNMAIIFFIFGLTTDTSELVMAVKAGKSLVFGLLSILFISPLLGFICMLIPFKPYEFALGLAVMACVPTSLSSGVTLVIGAYGNGALALLFTVSANILGIITSPLMVKLVLGSVTDAHVDTADLLVKLGVSILMPVLVGKGLREAVKPLRDNIYKFKAPLYLMNNLQITMIVWQKLSSARAVLVEQQLGDVFLAGLAAILLHFAFLFFNILATWLLRFPEKERKAIIVMASQKNLPTAAVIISYFDPASVGNLGLMTIPCIVFYIMQLFIDSFIANTWASKYERFAAVEASYNEQMQQLEGSSGDAEQVSSKVVAKLAAGAASLAAEGATAGVGSDFDRLISTVVAGGVMRPSRGALALRRSSHSDGEEAALMQNVELNEVNPMAEGKGAAAHSTQQHRVSWK